MGLGMISACSQQQFSTPNIDCLIERGTFFNRAYGCMLSAPARASFLTGYHDCHGEDKWNISPGGAYLRVSDEIRRNSEEENEAIKEICIRVEHVFGFMEHSMGGLVFRGVGIVRASAVVAMTNLTYNIACPVQIFKYHRDRIIV